MNDINAKFRRHVETTLLFLLSTRLPPYQPTSPTTPSPTLVVTSRHEPPPPPSLLTWLCFSFYQVASFPCIASPISLSRLGSTKGIPRLGLLYPLKRFSRTLMKKASPPPWDSRYYSTTSSFLPDLFILQPPLLNSAYFLLPHL